MRQIAPGRYEARLVLEKYGSFLLRADHTRPNDKGELTSVAVSYGHISNPYPREYASFEPDLGTLERAAAAASGSVDPSIATVFDPAGEKLTYHQDLWNKAIFGAIGLFLADLLLRRVRLFDRKFLPKKVKAARA